MMAVVTKRKEESTTDALQTRSSARTANALNALYGGVKGAHMAQTFRRSVETEGSHTAVRDGSEKKGGSRLSMLVRQETINVAGWL